MSQSLKATPGQENGSSGIKPGDTVIVADVKAEVLSVTNREVTVSMFDKPNACPHVFNVEDVTAIPEERWPEDEPKIAFRSEPKYQLTAYLNDNVNHPAHYGGGKNPYETIKVIEAWGFNFVEGNILKYLSRYRHKNGIEDLRKAKFYMDRLVADAEREESQKS